MDDSKTEGVLPGRDEGQGDASDLEAHEEDEVINPETVAEVDLRARNVAVGMASLDGLNMRAVLGCGAVVIKTTALKVAFHECSLGQAASAERRMVRVWKLFMLLPRIFLCHPLQGEKVPKNIMEDRCKTCALGE